MDKMVQTQLLVELLNVYMLFYEKGDDQVRSYVGWTVVVQLIPRPGTSRSTLCSLIPSPE